MVSNSNSPKVIVFGSEQFGKYLQSKNKNWYVQKPSDNVDDFWERIDLHEKEPDNPKSLDPDSEIVIFQNIFDTFDEIDSGVAGTASAFVHYDRSKVFAFGDEEFHKELVEKTEMYDFYVQKNEGVDEPVIDVEILFLTDDNEKDMLTSLAALTADVVNWGAPYSSHPPTTQHDTHTSTTSGAQPAPQESANRTHNHDKGAPKPAVIESKEPKAGHYTDETRQTAWQNYNKPEGAIPDQLTIAVMSAKGGSGKCLRGDMLVVNEETGELLPIESFVQNNDKASSAEENVSVLSFNGRNVQPEKVHQKFKSGQKETYTVRFASGRKVSATGNHPFLTADGWKKLEHLTEGETVATPARYPNPTHSSNVPRKNVIELANKLFRFYEPENVPHVENEPTTTGNSHLTHFVNDGFDVFRQTTITANIAPLRYIPSVVFSYSAESLAVLLNEFWSSFSSEPDPDDFITPIGATSPQALPQQQGNPQEDLHSLNSGTFVSKNNTLFVSFNATDKASEQLKGLFLRLGIVVVDSSKSFNYLPAHTQEMHDTSSRVNHYRWFVADFSAENFLKTLPLAPAAFKKHEKFIKKLPPARAKNAPHNPTFSATSIAEMKNIFDDNQNAHQITADAINEVFLPRKGQSGWGVINLDLLKSWGVPSGNAIGDHYGWLTSDDIFWDPVREITPDGVHKTYDIEIPTVHNFIANNVIVHNSTTAAMLASTIAQTTKNAGNPKKVVLVDLDTRDGQVGSLINQYMPTAINIRMIPPSKRTATAVLNNLVHDKELNIDALLAPVRPSTADDVGPEFYEKVIGTLQTTHDVVVIDCSVNYLDPLLGSAFKVSDEILFVTTLALTSIQGMGRALKEMTTSKEKRGLGIPPDKIKIVINQMVAKVGMPESRIVRSILNIGIAGKIPFAPKAVLIATNQSRLHRLFTIPKLAASYEILAYNCLKVRPEWKMKAFEKTRNINAIKTLIDSGRML